MSRPVAPLRPMHITTPASPRTPTTWTLPAGWFRSHRPSVASSVSHMVRPATCRASPVATQALKPTFQPQFVCATAGATPCVVWRPGMERHCWGHGSGLLVANGNQHGGNALSMWNLASKRWSNSAPARRADHSQVGAGCVVAKRAAIGHSPPGTIEPRWGTPARVRPPPFRFDRKLFPQTPSPRLCFNAPLGRRIGPCRAHRWNLRCSAFLLGVLVFLSLMQLPRPRRTGAQTSGRNWIRYLRCVLCPPPPLGSRFVLLCPSQPAPSFPFQEPKLNVRREPALGANALVIRARAVARGR